MDLAMMLAVPMDCRMCPSSLGMDTEEWLPRRKAGRGSWGLVFQVFDLEGQAV